MGLGMRKRLSLNEDVKLNTCLDDFSSINVDGDFKFKRLCERCGKYFLLTHKGRIYCDDCRGGLDE